MLFDSTFSKCLSRPILVCVMSKLKSTGNPCAHYWQLRNITSLFNIELLRLNSHYLILTAILRLVVLSFSFPILLKQFLAFLVQLLESTWSLRIIDITFRKVQTYVSLRLKLFGVKRCIHHSFKITRLFWRSDADWWLLY